MFCWGFLFGSDVALPCKRLRGAVGLHLTRLGPDPVPHLPPAWWCWLVRGSASPSLGHLGCPRPLCPHLPCSACTCGEWVAGGAALLLPPRWDQPTLHSLQKHAGTSQGLLAWIGGSPGAWGVGSCLPVEGPSGLPSVCPTPLLCALRGTLVPWLPPALSRQLMPGPGHSLRG